MRILSKLGVVIGCCIGLSSCYVGTAGSGAYYAPAPAYTVGYDGYQSYYYWNDANRPYYAGHYGRYNHYQRGHYYNRHYHHQQHRMHRH